VATGKRQIPFGVTDKKGKYRSKCEDRSKCKNRSKCKDRSGSFAALRMTIRC